MTIPLRFVLEYTHYITINFYKIHVNFVYYVI